MNRLTKFLSEVRVELAKVSWPTWHQTVNLTLVVIAVSLLVGLYVGGIDFVLAQLTAKFIR